MIAFSSERWWARWKSKRFWRWCKLGRSYLEIAVTAFLALLFRLVVFAEREEAAALVHVDVFIESFPLHQLVVGVHRFSG